jgi:REase_DpnII-MboI
MIELKYVRKPDDQKAIKSALLTDFADYGANPKVDYVIALTYDPSHQLPAAVQLRKDLSGESKGLRRVQVIVSPPRS